jgi:8-oxo-dGTP pyrophosphatase MutT (NUDIX family)
MNDEDRFRVSNKICLFQDESVLLLQNHEGVWELPGGHLDHDDTTPRRGLERELQEETGLAAENVELLDPHKHEDVVAFFWAGNPVGDDVTISDEHVDAAWVSLSRLDDHPITFDELRQMIRGWADDY